MSTFLISIEDNEKGVVIKAHDMRHPSDDKTVAHSMGCFLVDTLNQYLAAHGVERAVNVQSVGRRVH
ncbi:hypothetical protein [Methylomonas rapida]|uniref:Uncharacterized protein n=1 Tax=Methylomonas rapida TaxID=2963939 RepID=A0ABY7GHW8_9GAMM|nr:hypothetical protein [Methylomonas rapida]WAR43613.1 hypothetical protein NM686_014660 [Methylomonas rapida]WAR45484.1 hypothetical protein NM686_002930 [Methylomonas rapida]